MVESWLTQARIALGEYGWRRRLLFGRERNIAAALAKEGIEADVIPDYVRLTEHGRLVWGVVIQVESATMSDGPLEYPCNIVFSLQPYFETRPQHLGRIAAAISNLKHTFPTEPALAKAAAIITDEKNYVFNWRLPYRLTDGYEVYFSCLMLHRVRLPRRRLSGPFLPVVVAPGEVECCMLAPLSCWPAVLLAGHGEFEQVLKASSAFEARPVSEMQIAADDADGTAHPHKSVVAKDVVPGAANAVVTLTPACAAQMRLAAKRFAGRVWHVAIGGSPSGRTMDVQAGPPPTTHAAVESEGVTIAVPKSQVHQMRGTVIDFRQTPMGAGFVFVDP